jgi:hypothetical protein
MRVYYAAKPLLPRSVQLGLRRRYAVLQARRPFPAWPVEDVLVRLRDRELRARMAAEGTERLPLVGLWPDGHRFAWVITHDVEGPEGIARIPEVLEIERSHGVVSSWNFCGDWYDIPDGTFGMVRAAGGEVGLHGIRHDGRLFATRAAFEEDLPRIRRCMAAWGADGFRSPATHRNADWMPELGCLYDSSFPDTDPFEPQAGGCCSILPYFLGDVVELPITLVQDHTLWEILRHDDVGVWTGKASWLAARHGLVNAIVHPDYLDRPERVAMYEDLLTFLRGQPLGWHALPREVAAWWRERARLDIRRGPDGGARLVGEAGPAAAGAQVWWARAAGDGVAFEC